MTNENEIGVRVNPNIQQNGDKYYAMLEYYMENNPKQTEWRQIPGYVVGNDEAEVLSNANAIAAELDKLDLFTVQPAIRSLVESGKMIRKPE